MMGIGMKKPMMQPEEDDQGSKLLALQNFLDAIDGIAGDDMKPYIDNLKNQVHMQHESAEGDKMGMQDAQKPAMDVSIGMNGEKPPMEDDEDEDNEGTPSGGFLAVLTKKMKSKK